jgi:cyclophilin family peptidyl-prolyl cis-trans isomerase/protein-disulfide isomerase
MRAGRNPSFSHLCKSIHSGIGNNLLRFSVASLISVLTLICASCTPLAASQTPSPINTNAQAPVRLGPTATATQTPQSLPTVEPTPTLRPVNPISEDDWTRGAANAAVQVLVYSDFQCPYCADLSIVLDEMLERHPGDFQLAFRHFPLVSIHDKAFIAAQAAEAAGAQGQFWGMHDLLFKKRDEWIDLPPSDFPQWLVNQSRQLELDSERFENDLRSGAYAQVVEQAYTLAIESGIPGTPFIFFNGFLFRLNPSLLNMEAAVRLELLRQRQFSSPPQFELESGNLYFANLQLENGVVVIQLLPNQAPRAVSNFIALAEAGWYDAVPIYSVLPDRLVETGDPSGTGFGGPGYSFPDEISPDIRFDQPGVVAMSSSGPDTNGSRFFISLSDLPDLDGSRTVFGRVTAGLDLLRELHARDALDDLLVPAEGVIEQVEIEVR